MRLFTPTASAAPSAALRRGFTFVEVLAAMLLLAIVAPVFVEAMLLGNRAGVTADRKRVAARLAENQLRASVLDQSWRNGAQRGDFGKDLAGYRWALSSKPWSEDATMTEITVTVYYTVQEREFEISLTTLAETTQNTAATGTST